MIKKSKKYQNTRFSADVLAEAHDLFLSKIEPEKHERKQQVMRVSRGSESWEFDTREEFLAECRSAEYYHLDHISGDARLIVEVGLSYLDSSYVHVEFPTGPDIEAIFHVFERNLEASKIIVASDPIKVFIGHGRDPQWRDLKDHLLEQHGIAATTYEIGPRAGLSVKEVLERMLSRASFALLVLTGEDLHADGELHARENVIHELGLFQGRLGFTRAIVLLEEDVKEFSNILGINQIRFPKKGIRETFGDVVAAIRHEFGDKQS